MVAVYEIAGRKVGSHVLSIATLSTTFAISAFFMRGSGKSTAAAGPPQPPINAGSKDEESFIQQFMQEADAGKK